MGQTVDRRQWLIAIFAFVGLGGAMIQARGALVPTFEGYFTLSKSQLGLISPVGTVGVVAAMLWIGPASGRVDLRRFLLGASVLAALALAGIAAAPSFLALLVMEGVRSFAIGAFRALDRPTLSHLYPESRARIFSLQEMAWAVGATAGPLLVVVVLSWYSWRYAYVALAVLTLPVIVLLWRLEPPTRTAAEQSFELADARSVLGQPIVYAMIVALVLVGGIESTIFTWLPSYAEEMFASDIASVTLSVYLVAYVPGRLAFSRLAEHFRLTDLLAAVSGLLLVLLSATFVLAEGLELLVLIFASGLLVSGLFPTLLSLGIESNPAFTGPVNAIGTIAAQIGFFTVPPIVGVIADSYSVQQAMLVLIGLAAALAAVLVWLRLGPVEDGTTGA